MDEGSPLLTTMEALERLAYDRRNGRWSIGLQASRVGRAFDVRARALRCAPASGTPQSLNIAAWDESQPLSIHAPEHSQ